MASRGDRRQAGRCDGLAVALVVFIGYVKPDAASQLWKLDVENLPRAANDVVAAGAGRHPPEHQHVAEIVERRELRDAISEIGADGVVNLPGARVALGAERLYRSSNARAGRDRRERRCRQPA